MTDAAAAPEPFVFSAPLTVCLDVKHPQAHLALRPVQALAEELGIEVDWLPFPAPGLKPPPPEPAAGVVEDRGTRHRRHRARYVERDLERYAATAGLILQGLYRNPDTTRVSAALLWLRRHAPHRRFEFLERLFADYWAEQVDVENDAAISAGIDAMSLDGSDCRRYMNDEGPRELFTLRERLVAAGVFTVPSLVVEQDVFVGRAHLPMVRWLLTGRSAPPPI